MGDYLTELPIELWKEIFKHYPQVERVEIDPSTDHLDIIITGGRATLKTTTKKLNDDLFYKFNGNPCEAVTSFLKKYNILYHYRNTLVGYFDIIAYSDYLKNMGMERVICEMKKVVSAWKNSSRAILGGLKIDPLIYASDSFLLVLDTNRISLCSKTVIWFLATCSRLMGMAMETDHVPLRGAIGGGDFYKNGEILVSTALVDAVDYEKDQDWLGAVLTPQAVKIIRTVQDDLSSNGYGAWVGFGEIPWKKIPCKRKNREKTGYFIKPRMSAPNPKWDKQYLPPHFDSVKKKTMIHNSHRLYGKPSG